MEANKINYYQLSVEETLVNLKTNEEGLKMTEASQRLKVFGKNELTAIKEDSMVIKFFHQFRDLMVIILIIAGGLSFYLGENRDGLIMFIIVFINAAIGFVQEYKAEKVMDSLKTLVRAKAIVIRDGKELEIRGEELVPGDIVNVQEGDAVPADLRIFKENNLATNDFALTGESNPTRKFLHEIKGNCPLGNRNNLVFMGTTVATGNGLGIVIATGMQTEIGRIANLSQQSAAEFSPLQKELNTLAKSLTKIIFIIGGGLFLFGLVLKFSLRDSFLFALSIAASCVPEGMPAQVSVALSLAAGRLAKQKAVVKKLSAVETLGSTHIICTDKTGTLTKNEMTVQKLMIGSKQFEVSGIGYASKGSIIHDGKELDKSELKKYQLFFENGVFASNASVNSPDSEHGSWYAIGDPTEAALITLAKKAGLDTDILDRQFPEIHEYTFDSVRKRMSSVRKLKGKFGVYVKGSPESVLEKCTQIWDGEKIRKITKKDRDLIIRQDDLNALTAMRNLGYAYREISTYNSKIKLEQIEEELIWLGLVSMIDPPREEVQKAMEAAQKAHIRVIIITGDYALTARSIAEKIGLNAINKESKITVINGDDLEKLSDVELLHKLMNANLVFSRTSPEDKLRIVGLLKKAGEIVAVTGDGVNDAPALKKADIGVAMGKTGTEVAKNSSEIILLDDSFATLVSAIREGRIIFQNLKKTILSSLTSNAGELFAVLLSLPASLLLGYPISIVAVQILAIDLVGEMLPLTFLTWDPPQPRIMTEPPRDPNEHILNKSSLIDLTWSGLLMGAIGYFNFLMIFFREHHPMQVSMDDPFYLRATTLTYLSIVLIQWTNILSRRAGGQEFVLSSYLWSNKKLLWGYGISLFLLLMIIYNPVISEYTYTAPLNFIDWIYALGGAAFYLAVRETYKYFRKQKLNKFEISR